MNPPFHKLMKDLHSFLDQIMTFLTDFLRQILAAILF